ncbi:alpha beta hydrolase [Fusarium austroafricanum]|uniref:Alpha beta hydrolase n=1 Tax=Fusarium austroafricanum TaxID=2364996 RepID=A0A8H4KL36_9HYPO|nr:alpha beta hydrolase [Fusarium austroafricanum]
MMLVFSTPAKAMALLYFSYTAGPATVSISCFKSLGYRVITFDVWGHGRSSVPPETSPEQLRPEVTSDDTVALLHSLDISEPCIVVAHSLGCLIASLLSVRSPDVVKALILAGPLYYQQVAQLTVFYDMMKGGNARQIL